MMMMTVMIMLDSCEAATGVMLTLQGLARRQSQVIDKRQRRRIMTRDLLILRLRCCRPAGVIYGSVVGRAAIINVDANNIRQ